MINNTNYESVLQRITMEQEWDTFNRLTNNRGFKNNNLDGYKNTVLSGYNKIINFVNTRK